MSDLNERVNKMYKEIGQNLERWGYCNKSITKEQHEELRNLLEDSSYNIINTEVDQNKEGFPFENRFLYARPSNNIIEIIAERDLYYPNKNGFSYAKFNSLEDFDNLKNIYNKKWTNRENEKFLGSLAMACGLSIGLSLSATGSWIAGTIFIIPSAVAGIYPVRAENKIIENYKNQLKLLKPTTNPRCALKEAFGLDYY